MTMYVWEDHSEVFSGVRPSGAEDSGLQVKRFGEAAGGEWRTKVLVMARRKKPIRFLRTIFGRCGFSGN